MLVLGPNGLKACHAALDHGTLVDLPAPAARPVHLLEQDHGRLQLLGLGDDGTERALHRGLVGSLGVQASGGGAVLHGSRLLVCAEGWRVGSPADIPGGDAIDRVVFQHLLRRGTGDVQLLVVGDMMVLQGDIQQVADCAKAGKEHNEHADMEQGNASTHLGPHRPQHIRTCHLLVSIRPLIAKDLSMVL